MYGRREGVVCVRGTTDGGRHRNGRGRNVCVCCGEVGVVLLQYSLQGVAHALSAVVMRLCMAVQNGQEGKTALELAADEGTIKCFLDHGVKLADIVTDEVVIACVAVSDGPALYVRGVETEEVYMLCVSACQDTGE